MALQQIHGDQQAITQMLGIMYDNAYKQRSPDITSDSKEKLGQQLGLDPAAIKAGKKGDFVKALIEKELGTRDEYVSKSLTRVGNLQEAPTDGDD